MKLKEWINKNKIGAISLPVIMMIVSIVIRPVIVFEGTVCPKVIHFSYSFIPYLPGFYISHYFIGGLMKVIGVDVSILILRFVARFFDVIIFVLIGAFIYSKIRRRKTK